jgi:hypothetical protein
VTAILQLALASVTIPPAPLLGTTLLAALAAALDTLATALVRLAMAPVAPLLKELADTAEDSMALAELSKLLKLLAAAPVNELAAVPPTAVTPLPVALVIDTVEEAVVDPEADEEHTAF